MSAAEEAKAAQEARSKKYGIAIKEGGHVTKPSEWASVPDDEFLDPVNYRYPCPNADQVAAAARYWGRPDNQAQYSSEERAIIEKRLVQFEKKYKIGKYEETGWVPVFRAGKYPQGSYMEQDLDGIVERYDPVGAHEAPISIDHVHSGPAQGWVSQLKREGKLLYARFRQVSEDFKKQIREGRYKKPSAEIHPNYQGTGQPYFYGVTFLGAKYPQIKGLTATFSSAGNQTISIPFEEEETMPSEETLARQLAEQLTEKNAELAKFREQQQQFSEQQKQQAAEMAATEVKIKQLMEEQKRRDEQIAQFKEENDRKDIMAFVEGQIRDGKALPAWKDAGLMEFMQSLEGEGHDRLAKFAEQGKSGPVSQRDWFKRFLGSLPKVVEFNEIITNSNASEIAASGADPGQKLDVLTAQKMKEYAEQGRKDLTYAQVFSEVQIEHRALAEQYEKSCHQSH